MQARKVSTYSPAGRTLKGDTIARTVTLPAALALRLLCVVRGLTVDALAAPLQRVEFGGAPQPLLPGEHIGAIWGKPDGPGPFFPLSLVSNGCHGCKSLARRLLYSWLSDVLYRAALARSV